MYKELYKQEINILGISSSIYLISMNEYMKTILNRYKMKYNPLLTNPLPPRLYKYIEAGVEFRKDVNSYTYKCEENFELFYEDKTGNECSNNKIYVDKYQNTEYTLRICLNFVFALAKLLEEFPDNFNIILSVNQEDFVISFHCVRETEQWLDEDLDSYPKEAIFVLTTKESVGISGTGESAGQVIDPALGDM